MQLVEQGKISLDDAIKDELPELELRTNTTLKNLLNHTSGIKDYTEVDYLCGSQDGTIDPKEFAKCFNALESEFPSGTAFSYSNTNYYLLGLLIEEVTGKSYEDNLRKIF